MPRPLASLAALALCACGAAFVAPPVTPQLVDVARSKWTDATPASLQRGHDTFVAGCGKGGFCHQLKSPQAFPAEKWPRIVERMGKKARLDAAQQQDVLRFVLAVRELPPPGPASAPTTAPPR
jgi:hypothetical protein